MTCPVGMVWNKNTCNGIAKKYELKFLPDIIKIAMIDIANTLIKQGLKSKMILQIHDELIFEMHPSEELKLKSIVESCMIKASTLDVPIVVDMGIGNNWLEAH